MGQGEASLSLRAVVSGVSPSPAQVQDMANCETESHRLSKPYVEHKWAYKTPMQPLGSSARVTANTSLRRNLMSAPPVMRHLRDKEPAGPVPLQVAG